MSYFVKKADVSRKTQEELLLTQAATAGALWSSTGIPKEIREILHAVAAWPEVWITPSRNGVCVTLGNMTLGHLNWDGRIDLPFGPDVLRPMMAEWMVQPGRGKLDGGGAVFEVRAMGDVERAVWLLRLAYLIGDSKVDVCRAETVGDAEQGYEAQHELGPQLDYIPTRPSYPA